VAVFTKQTSNRGFRLDSSTVDLYVGYGRLTLAHAIEIVR